MKSYEVTIGKVYRAKLGSPNGGELHTMMLVVDCEDKHMNIGGHDRCIAEWVYYLPFKNGYFGTFTELDNNVLDSMSEIKNEISLRNLCQSLKDRSTADDERLSKWIRNKDVALSMVLSDHQLLEMAQ